VKQPSIFLSHSSKDVGLTTTVSAALTTPEGDHPGYEVLVDMDCLNAGELWPAQLNAMMADADAGLILLTREAINRPDWVRNEVYILAWRHSLDPKFKLFYVLLDDVTSDDLSATGFDPAHLRLIQELPVKDCASIARIAMALGPKGVWRQTPLDELSSKLAEALKGVSTDLLANLAERLHAPRLGWRPNGGAVQRIAAQILAGRLGDNIKLSDLINELISLQVPPASLKIALRWIAPFWLPPEASGRFATVIEELWQESKGGNAVINGKYVIRYTAEMFVFKARPFDFHCRVAEIESPANKADGQYYKHQICEWLRAKMEDDYEGLNDNEIVDLLKSEEPFLFVPLPKPVPDKDTLRELRDYFPRVVFLFWTGETVQDVDYDGPVVFLKPPIDVVSEHDQFMQWRNAGKAIRG
jgi:hypothetical protein